MLKKIFLALSCALVAACNSNIANQSQDEKPIYSLEGNIPIRSQISLDKDKFEKNINFSIPADDVYAIYLVFSRPNFKEKTEKTEQMDNQLSEILANMESRNSSDKPSPEKIHFKLQIENLDNNQIIFNENIDFDDNQNFQQIIKMHDDKEHIAIITHLDQDSKFQLKKGNYRLTFKNQYNSLAYMPYEIQIQISKPYKLKI